MLHQLYTKLKHKLQPLAKSKNQFKLKCSLFALSFSESIFFPIPPDSLLIPLAMSRRDLSFSYAQICSIASIIGGIAGYLLGWLFWDLIEPWFLAYASRNTIDLFEQMQHLYQEYDFWIIFTAGFTPIPYKLFTLSAGLFNISFYMFVIASLISRSLRFYLVSYLIYRFGATIQNTIEAHLNKITILITILLIMFYILFYY